MTNWRKFLPTMFAFAIAALALPVVASAQYGGYGGYGQNGGYGDNGRYGRNGNYGNNDRGLKDAIKRVKDRSNDFRKHLDSALDHSRVNGTRREDELNSLADSFHDAADSLKDRFGNGRDFNQSRGEADRLVRLGSQIDRMVGRGRLDSRSANDWYQIQSDLNYIANAFGIDNRYNGGYNNGGYDNGGYDRGRGRGRGRDRNNGNNNGNWWPF